MIKTSVYKHLTVFLLFLISFVIRLIALQQTPFANGWDGYYYIMQMYTFIEKGAMRAPDYSIIYPYYIALSYIIGNHLLAFKVGSALLAGFFTSSTYYFSIQILTSESKIEQNVSKIHKIALLVASLSVFSPTLTYFTAQFPKNLLGVILLLWFIYFLQKKNLLGAALLFILTFLTHRMTAGLAVILLVINILASKKKWILIVIGILTIIMTIFLPGILHYTDIQRFSNNISLNFPPYELISYFGSDKITIYWLIEIILLFCIFITSIILLIYRILRHIKSSIIYILLIVILLILSLPIFPFEQADIGFRFYLTFNILALLLVPIVVQKVHPKLLIAGTVLLLVLSVFSFRSYQPKTQDPNYTAYFQIIKELSDKLQESPDLIVAHQGLAQMVIVYTQFEATNWQPLPDQNKKIWRIAADIPYYYYNKYLNSKDLEKVKHLYKNYYLIQEQAWQTFKTEVEKSSNEPLKIKTHAWYNPSEYKPGYLLKGRGDDYVQ